MFFKFLNKIRLLYKQNTQGACNRHSKLRRTINIYKKLNGSQKKHVLLISFTSGEQEEFFMLCDVLPEDKELRQFLQKDKLVNILILP